MQFDSLGAFFEMGGYAFYVWLSYGFSFVCLLTLVVTSHNGHKRIQKQILKRLQREQKLRQAVEQQNDNSKQVLS
jgi:heme exporter protein D